MTKPQHLPHHSHNVTAIFYMLIHVIAIAVLYACVKGLTHGLSTSLVVFLYKIAILICIIPWCFHSGLASMKTRRIGLHIFRGFLSVFAQICMFYGLKNLILMDVTAIQYMEHVIVLIIGIFYFKEKATKTKLAAISISILGMLAVVKPDYSLSNFNYNFIFVFIGLVLYAINNTTVKVLGQTEKTKVQLFYVTLVSSICAFPIALMEWELVGHLGMIPLSVPYAVHDFSSLGLQPHHFWVILLLALCYFIHAIFHFQAFKLADISMLISLEYTKLIFVGILGFIFFNEAMPANHKILGYLLITGAGLYLVYSERRKVLKARKKRQELEQAFEVT